MDMMVTAVVTDNKKSFESFFSPMPHLLASSFLLLLLSVSFLLHQQYQH